MAIKDLVRPELPPPTPAAERPPNITCEKYTRGEDGKRCIHFQQGGTCALPDEFVCTEWQKHNGPNKRTLPVVAAAPVVEHAPGRQRQDLVAASAINVGHAKHAQLGTRQPFPNQIALHPGKIERRVARNQRCFNQPDRPEIEQVDQIADIEARR